MSTSRRRGRPARTPKTPNLNFIHLERETRSEAADVVGELWHRAREAAFEDFKMPIVAVRTDEGVVLLIHEADLPSLDDCSQALADLASAG